MIDSLRSQLNALASLVSDETRSREPQPDKQDSTFEKVAAEQEQAFLDRIERAGNTTERDSLLGQLALHLVQRGDLRARDYASRIDDSELRKNAQGYVDASLSRSLIGKQSVDEALEIATRGELTHLQRAWVMVECAKILFKTDRQKSLDLIETATSEARRMDVSDPYLPRALLSIANAVLLIDKQRSWDAAFDAIKAANSAETFTGEDGQLTIQFKSKQQTSISSVNVPDFNVEGLFRQLALRDYDRAVELARGFQAEGPRALATIAIARAVLNEKKAPADVKK